MKLPSLDLTKRQKIWLIIIAIIIATIPLFYVINFFSFPISKNSADWGTFGDFIGGILNPIISLLTLIVTIIIALAIGAIDERRHNETIHNPVKPYLVLKSGEFFTSFHDSRTLDVWNDYSFFYKKPKSAPSGLLGQIDNSFYLKLANKGLGSATALSVTYGIDLNLLSNILSINEPNMVASFRPIQIDQQEQRQFMVLNFNQNNGNYKGGVRIFANQTYNLGLVEKKEKVKIPFPSDIITCFKLHNLKRGFDKPLDDFPIVAVTFNYCNIYGKRMTDKFLLQLIHVQDYQTYSMFRLLQKRIDN